jgi:alpha-L-fucosidase
LLTHSSLIPEPYGVVPSSRQIRHHEREFYGFIHFTINTFTDKEWGYGDESPALFDPTDFDADQIVGVAAEAGMAGLILTCKHHDGFCLWPTETTAHSVKSSPFRGGKSDIVREMADACRRHGLEFGVYLSPWDRNSPLYGTPEYVTDIYRPQLRELLTRYGPLFEVWFDGANGGDGFYGGTREPRKIDPATYYEWPKTWGMVRELQPHAVIFSDIGPDVRWVGNERGVAGDPCWATLHVGDAVPGVADHGQLNRGDRDGATWLIPECDVSIRPGWFWHENEDTHVRSPKNLMDLYFQSIGRGATFLLNLTPDRRGRIPEPDVASLQRWKSHIDATFVDDGRGGATFSPAPVDGLHVSRNVTVAFPEKRRINVVRLRENLRWGQRVDAWELDIWQEEEWHTVVVAQAIGAQRLIRFREVSTDRIRLRITAIPVDQPALSEIAFFFEPSFPEHEDADTRQTVVMLDADAVSLDDTTVLYDLRTTAQPIQGFIYTPNTIAPHIADRYRISASNDNIVWSEVTSGEFSNIRNNPIPQVVRFTIKADALFVRVQILRFAIGERLDSDQVQLFS